jgi:hypothetical protein
MPESDPKTPHGGDGERMEYEAPGIEAVLTPEELEREVLYGGNGSPVNCL